MLNRINNEDFFVFYNTRIDNDEGYLGCEQQKIAQCIKALYNLGSPTIGLSYSKTQVCVCAEVDRDFHLLSTII